MALRPGGVSKGVQGVCRPTPVLAPGLSPSLGLYVWQCWGLNQSLAWEERSQHRTDQWLLCHPIEKPEDCPAPVTGQGLTGSPKEQMGPHHAPGKFWKYHHRSAFPTVGRGLGWSIRQNPGSTHREGMWVPDRGVTGLGVGLFVWSQGPGRGMPF